MKKLKLSFWILLFCCFEIMAQPCNFPFAPTNTCSNAPTVCTLDGYCADNSDAVNSGTPNAFCGQVENNNWIAFIAGSTSFELEISVFNCNQNNGLQAQFFSSEDCNNFTAVSNCLDPVLGSDNLVCSNLTIGERYFLMMDGKGGDVCDYEYALIEGIILSPASVEIVPTNPLCEDGSTILESNAISSNANLTYSWTTSDGNIISDPTLAQI